MRHQEPFEAPGVTGAAPPRSAGRPATFTEKAAGLVRRLADILASPNALRPPEPVVPRIAWAGRVTLLAAREKLGKTTLAAAAAAAVSTGSPWLNERVTPGDVLWVGLEEHVSDMARRLFDFGADPDRVFIVERPPADLSALRAIVEETRPVLIVVDSLAEYARDLVTDPSSAAEWTRVMSPLVRIARDYEAALLLVHHARKSDGKYRDSSAIGAAVDMILEMEPGREETARKFTASGRWAVPNLLLCFDGTQYTEVGPLRDRVLQFVTSHPGSNRREVRSGVGARLTDVDAALDALVAEGAVENRGNGTAHAYFVSPHDAAGRTPSDQESATQQPLTAPEDDPEGVSRVPLGDRGQDTHHPPRDATPDVSQPLPPGFDNRTHHQSRSGGGNPTRSAPAHPPGEPQRDPTAINDPSHPADGATSGQQLPSDARRSTQWKRIVTP